MTASAVPAIVRAADGVPLKTKLRSVERARQIRAVLLVLPLFIFITVSFVAPILVTLRNAVYDPKFSQVMPLTTAAIKDWKGDALPDEAVFAALAADLRQTQKDKTTAFVGKRLNYEISGIRSKVIATGREIGKLQSDPDRQAILAMDPVWGEITTWAAIRNASATVTSFYVAAALDLRWTPDGNLVNTPPEMSIYRDVLVRTMGISLTVTVVTLLLGFPLAYLLAMLPPRTGNVLMILVLIPFWTSLLVRTTAWFVLLQDNGMVNDALQALHIVDHPLRLIFSRTGTIVAMTHIQLPFTLLPIYSVMKTISPSYVRAARSLGAGPFYAFWRVYFPQTMPGIAAGCLLTFILCLGYYITPALVGGPADQMVSNLVEVAINRENNWGKASALATILLVATLILYFVYNRLVGIEKLKLG